MRGGVLMKWTTVQTSYRSPADKLILVMNPEKFREMALSFPETTEGGHRDHPDYRVADKVFASLCPKELWGVVKVTPQLQSELLEEAPGVFEACNGAWGKSGATIVKLENAEEGDVVRALIAAWRKNAPDSLEQDFDQQNS